MGLDRFGITQLYEALNEDARVWVSNWDNGPRRTLDRENEHDPGLVVRGKNPRVDVDGRGTAIMAGCEPRLYVYEPRKTWQNVEITFYAKRGEECGQKSSQGFTAGARSEHQDATPEDPCPGYAYYGRMLYSGRVNFQKEIAHESYSGSLPSENYRAEWGTPNGQIPTEIWIGYKFVVRNLAANSQVQLELYRDLTNGEIGGNWELLMEPLIDQG